MPVTFFEKGFIRTVIVFRKIRFSRWTGNLFLYVLLVISILFFQNCGTGFSVRNPEDFDPSLSSTATTADTSSVELLYSDVIGKSFTDLVEPVVDPSGKDKEKSPSLVLGVVKNGVAYAYGYGTTTLGEEVVPDGDTLYGIGSISKIITAIILADSIEKKEMSLSQGVADVLPEPLNNLFDKRVTLEHLVTHFSGLPSFPSNSMARGGAADYSINDLESCLRRGGCVPISVPGSKYQYSNYGSGLVGFILQTHYGASSFGDVLNRKFVSKLGLIDTGIPSNEFLNLLDRSSRLALGYDTQNNQLAFARMGLLDSAGEIVSTTNDLNKILLQLTGEDSSELSAGIERAMSPLRKTEAIRSSSELKSIGFAIESYSLKGYSNLCGVALSDVIVYSKSGTTPSHRSFVIWNREKRVGVSLLANRGQLTNEFVCLAHKVLNRLMGSEQVSN